MDLFFHLSFPLLPPLMRILDRIKQQALLETHPEVHKFLSHITDTAKKGKRGRPRKPKSLIALSGTKSKHKTSTDLTEIGSDTVNTRSKHGVIKSNPKYDD
ncbi:hypothetical protein MTR_2g048185 [Medicago truncatula]|uniref:Uncharacterized protein n=1 Tax=Medicago truncatula TaxID=3880 RepID=A0A072V8Z0_MEDTR|nr:hypothetical protein MTR_2g048185 [Medicago truncatula]